MIQLSSNKSMQSPIIAEFYILSEDNHIVRACCELWKRKQLTLEQALDLAVTELGTACDSLAKQLPAGSSTLGNVVYYDYTNFVVSNSEYSLSLKMRYLTKHYKALFDLLISYSSHPIQNSIRMEIGDELAKSLRNV